MYKTISESIGKGGYNNSVKDVKTVQELLNAIPVSRRGSPPYVNVTANGLVGYTAWKDNWNNTLKAILAFQKANGCTADGRVDPERYGGTTIVKLNAAAVFDTSRKSTVPATPLKNGWQLVHDAAGNDWVANRAWIHYWCENYVNSMLMFERSHTVTETHLFLPDIISVETDYGKDFIHTQDHLAQLMYETLNKKLAIDGRQVFNELVKMKKESNSYTRILKKMNHDAFERTRQNIDTSLRRDKEGIKYSKMVRDASIGTEIAVASIVTAGGADVAMGWLGIGEGAMLKGSATYQDTGNVGASAVDAFGVAVVAAVPIPAKMAEEHILAQAAESGVNPVSAVFKNKVYWMFAGSAATGGVSLGSGLIKGDNYIKSLSAAAMNAGLSLFPIDNAVKKSVFNVYSRAFVEADISYGTDKWISKTATMLGGKLPVKSNSKTSHKHGVLDVSPQLMPPSVSVESDIRRTALHRIFSSPVFAP